MMKNQKYNFLYRSSSTDSVKAELGTIEKDASGFNGLFNPERFRGEEIIRKLLSKDFSTVLDIGAGKKEKTNFLSKHGKKVYTNGITKGSNALDFYDYDGDFNSISFNKKFDVSLCSHVLEHQLNTHEFLENVVSVTKENGYIVIIVPPRKPFIIGGHVSIWNAGLVLYHLVLAGVDCSVECNIKQYDYNIGIIVKNVPIKEDIKSSITFDGGDIDNFLSKYFPVNAHDGFNGDIMEFNW
jgi:SAM-dependent methyltransferase